MTSLNEIEFNINIKTISFKTNFQKVLISIG